MTAHPTPTSQPALATRLLRQPNLGHDQVAFAYGGDLWLAGAGGGPAQRLTSTPALPWM